MSLLVDVLKWTLHFWDVWLIIQCHVWYCDCMASLRKIYKYACPTSSSTATLSSSGHISPQSSFTVKILFVFVCLFFPSTLCPCASIHHWPLPPLMHRCLPEFEWRGCDRMACPPGYLERCGGASYATDQENYPLPPNNQSHRREERVRKCKNYPTWWWWCVNFYA